MSYITEDQFQDWMPHLQISGDYFEFEDVKDLDPHTVWTIVDDGGETENLYAEPGFHIVNVLGYITTEKPWVTGEENAIWFFDSRFFIDFTCNNCHEEASSRVEDDDTIECNECDHVTSVFAYVERDELARLRRAHFEEFGEVFVR